MINWPCRHAAGSKTLYCYADAKHLTWYFGPIEKSRVNHASFIDLAPRQYLSYLIEIKFILKRNDDSTNPHVLDRLFDSFSDESLSDVDELSDRAGGKTDTDSGSIFDGYSDVSDDECDSVNAED